MATLGAPADVNASESENNLEIEELGRFAVDEHNKKANSLLEFSRVVSAKQQVVAGTKYFLTVEVMEGSEKKLYETQVWVQPWLNSKQIVEFKPVEEHAEETS